MRTSDVRVLHAGMCVGLVFCLGCAPDRENGSHSASAQAPAEAPSTNGTTDTHEATEAEERVSVVIAIDFSRSFAPLDGSKTAALEAMASALQTAMTKRWPSASLYVTPIGNASLLASPPCGPAILYRALLIAPRETNPINRTISTPTVLSKWWSECIRQLSVKSQDVEPFTDISGAVALATQSLKLNAGPKLLGIVSDFVEDLPKGHLAADFQLSGERVLLLYGPETSDGRNPNMLTKRLSDWERRLQSAGASSVLSVPIAGLTPESLQTWIQ